MNILIFGGTRFFGKDIVENFLKTGNDVTVFTRGNKPAAPAAHHQIGDRKNHAQVVAVLKSKNWDIVIDNLAYSAEDIEPILQGIKSETRYFLTSSIAVFRYMRKPWTTPFVEKLVDYDYNPREENLQDIHWAYARGRLEAEKKIASQNKIKWTIFRPAVVFGDEDPTLQGFWYLKRVLSGGPILLADGGNFSFRLAYRPNVARAYFLAAQSEKSVQKKYYLAQPEILTLRQWIEYQANSVGISPEFAEVPSAVAKEMGGPYATMPLANLIPSIEASRKDLDMEFTPLTQAIENSSKWFLSAGEKFEQENFPPDHLLATRQSELELIKKLPILS